MRILNPILMIVSLFLGTLSFAEAFQNIDPSSFETMSAADVPRYIQLAFDRKFETKACYTTQPPDNGMGRYSQEGYMIIDSEFGSLELATTGYIIDPSTVILVDSASFESRRQYNHGYFNPDSQLTWYKIYFSSDLKKIDQVDVIRGKMRSVDVAGIGEDPNMKTLFVPSEAYPCVRKLDRRDDMRVSLFQRPGGHSVAAGPLNLSVESNEVPNCPYPGPNTLKVGVPRRCDSE